MGAEGIVFVVDDNAEYRESLTALMASVGLAVETYASAEEFLEQRDPSEHGCLILDLRMSGMSGLELQEELVRRHVTMPVIIVSAHGNIDRAVRAMKSGAVDFLRKPYSADELLHRVRNALALDARMQEEEAIRSDARSRVLLLTPREREVMDLLVEGMAPKQIAFTLSLSRKTVDAHRGHIMMKLQAESLADLIHMSQVLDTNGDGRLLRFRPEAPS